MSKIEALKNAKSKADLADLLDVKTSFLTYVLYKIKPENQYDSFEIPKKTGGFRTISAPRKRLKALQSSLSTLLQDCMEELIKTRKREDKSFKESSLTRLR